MPEAHRREAIATNQRAWELLGQTERTAEEDLLLLSAAHASLYHWRIVGTPVHWARADWLVARVYCVLGQAALALSFARRCLLITETEGFDGFDLAYAYEGMARAHAANGDLEVAAGYLERARAAAEAIADPEDRAIFDEDLRAEPWFGLPA